MGKFERGLILVARVAGTTLGVLLSYGIALGLVAYMMFRHVG